MILRKFTIKEQGYDSQQVLLPLMDEKSLTPLFPIGGGRGAGAVVTNDWWGGDAVVTNDWYITHII